MTYGCEIYILNGTLEEEIYIQQRQGLWSRAINTKSISYKNALWPLMVTAHMEYKPGLSSLQPWPCF